MMIGKISLIALLLAAPWANAETLAGKVVSVTDGDTITVLDGANEQHKIRLAGIDAPEKAQPFGQRSKAQMSDLVFGKPVAVEWSKRDRYQRIIGKVLVADRDAGLALVSAGLAWHYKQYQKEQTTDDQVRYSAAEDAARARHAGLWADPNPVPPWEWRAAKRQSHSGASEPSPTSTPCRSSERAFMNALRPFGGRVLQCATLIALPGYCQHSSDHHNNDRNVREHS